MIQRLRNFILRVLDTLEDKLTYDYKTITIGELHEMLKPSQISENGDDGELKFIESAINTLGIEIDTPNGYVPLVNTFKTVKYKTYNLMLQNGLTLSGADKHLVQTNSGLKWLQELTPNDYVMTKFGYSKVYDVEELTHSENMYDLQLADGSDHLYYTNGIVSHNTTVITAYILWKLIFAEKGKPFRAACLSKTQEAAVDILDRIKFAIERLPKWLQPGIVKYNEKTIEFEGDSWVIARATSPSSIRGKTLSLLFLDEFAFVPAKMSEAFMRSAMPAIYRGKNTQICIASTPDGLNQFFDLWRTAHEDDSIYYPVEVDWWEIPGRDEKFKQLIIRNHDIQFWNQEYACLSGDSIIKLLDTYTNEEIEVTMAQFHKQLA